MTHRLFYSPRSSLFIGFGEGAACNERHRHGPEVQRWAGPQSAVGVLAVSDRESMTLGEREHQQFRQRRGGQRTASLLGLRFLALLALSSLLSDEASVIAY